MVTYTIDPKVHTTIELVTPDMAKEWMKSNTSNRPLSQATVKRFIGAMQRGEWMLNGEAICFDIKGNLVNGQHRLTAILQSNITVPLVLVWNVPEGAFATYDSGKKRTSAEVFATKGISNYVPCSAMVRKALMLQQTDRNIIRGASTVGRLTNATNLELLNEYEANKDKYDISLSTAKAYYRENSKFFTIAEIGAMVYHLRFNLGHSPETISAFFDELYFGGKDYKIKRAYELRKALINNNDARTRKLQASIKGQLVIRAWNFYVSNNSRPALMPSAKEESQSFR